MGSTTEDLIEDLEKELKYSVLITEEQKAKIPAIIQKAKEGYYHDFQTPIATPKIQLHQDLLDAGLENLDKKMQNGDYDDESPSEVK